MMKIVSIHNIQDFYFLQKDCFCCIGFFDGIHLGHQKILKQCVLDAKKEKKQTIILTFSDDCVLSLKKSMPLCQQELKLQAFKQLGIDVVYIFENHAAIFQFSGLEFIQKVLLPLNVQRVYCGNDFSFGSDFKKANDLKEFIPVIQLEDYIVQKNKISSSYIKQLLQNGNVTLANQYLYDDYTIIGTVIHGKQLGRTLDCKTANLKVKYPLFLKEGVYFGFASYQNQYYKAMINVGKNPTTDHDLKQKIEVHLLNFNQDIYHQTLKVTFLEYHRQEIKFADLEALKKCLKEDKIALENFKIKGEKKDEKKKFWC